MSREPRGSRCPAVSVVGRGLRLLAVVVRVLVGMLVMVVVVMMGRRLFIMDVATVVILLWHLA